MKITLLTAIFALIFGLNSIKAQNMIDKEIKDLTQSLIDNGTKYDLDFLNNIYDENLKFIQIDKENNI